jgi:3,4-dihydroxy 2-butanone 4-phosphate synthase/GTP cyclohydrolase II
MPLASLEEALDDFRAGKFVIIVDSELRENEGDLAIAADKITPNALNFIIQHARGLVCVPVTGERLDELSIPMMASRNCGSQEDTAFAASVDYNIDTTTGISTYDRAATIRALINPAARPDDFRRPGHTFPLRYRSGGVLARAGHTEAVIDMCLMANSYPAGVVCEIISDDGNMARMPQLEVFAQKHGLKILSIAQIIAYRRRHEKLVERVAEARLPTKYGEFKIIGYQSSVDSEEHIALTMGEWSLEEPVLVRIHSECLTGEVFGSQRCDCGEQIEMSLEALAKEGKGVFLYMRQEGRGIGLHNKIRAYSLQDDGQDTVEANQSLGFEPDLRDYGIGAQMLLDLGVRKLRLMTNNPGKMAGLSGFGLEILERIPVEAQDNDENRQYMETKRGRMGHFIPTS